MNIETTATHLKKEILIRLVKAFFSEDFESGARLIPFDMRPKGSEVTFRCCIHKERAILKDRAIAGLGFLIEEDDERKSLRDYAREACERKKPLEIPLTVLSEACKGCPSNRVYVTDLCQGCVARPCVSTCKFSAISIVNGRSVIDNAKCKHCKMCIQSCPYHAIAKISVPCEDSCPVGAIFKNGKGAATIDFNKCIACGKCVSACPFGAIHEVSQIIDILTHIKKGHKTVAMIAPSIVGQFPGNVYQLKAAIKKCGFADVVEVAEGADVTTRNEAREFEERMSEKAPFMTTSCCAAYNNLVEKHMKEIKPYVSNTKTPLYYIAEKVKKQDPSAVTVFISPCVAKRTEATRDGNIDYVMNFEELGALFIGRNIEVMSEGEEKFAVESSKQGRKFGISSGVAQAVSALAKDVKPHYIDGLTKESIRELSQYAKSGSCPGCNLIEVMGCKGGCVGGNAVINRNKSATQTLSAFADGSGQIKE